MFKSGAITWARFYAIASVSPSGMGLDLSNLTRMECPRCGKMNEPSAKFCSRCGIEMATVQRPSQPTEADAVPCYRHKRELTRLSCGKCGKPVCLRCAINGPAGIRCPECGKLEIPVSWSGYVYGIKRNISGLFGKSPYTIYIAFLIVSSLFGIIRSCAMSQPRSEVPISVKESRQSRDSQD